MKADNETIFACYSLTAKDILSAGLTISEVIFIRDETGNIKRFEASNGQTKAVFSEK